MYLPFGIGQQTHDNPGLLYLPKLNLLQIKSKISSLRVHTSGIRDVTGFFFILLTVQTQDIIIVINPP